MSAILRFVQSQPWMILPEYLDLIVEIASRERTPEEVAKGIKEAQEKADERANSPAALAIKQGEPLGDNKQVRVRDGVAVVSVIGPIVRYADLFSDISGATSTENLARNFAQADSAPGVNSIALFIDSPGGEAFGIAEMAQIISQASKPVVAYVGGYGASAAYYLASAADEIVADSAALLGSIGTVMEATDYSKAYAQRGITKHQYVSAQSPKKRPRMGTESGDAQMQEIVDDLGQVFVEDVARFRNVSVKKVLSDFGQGGLLSGQKAVAAGLADRLGSFEGVLAEMAAGKVKRKKRKTMGATAADDNTLPDAGENSGGHDMSEKKEKGFFARLFSGMSAEEKQEAAKLLAGESDEQPAKPAQQPAPHSAEKPAAQAAVLGETEETKKLREQVAQLQESNYKSEALAFIQPLIVAGIALPAESDGFVKDYVQRAKDDAASPLAEGSRVESLKAVYNNRPAHALTREQLKARMNTATVLADSEDPEAKAIEEERESARKYAEKANGKKKTA